MKIFTMTCHRAYNYGAVLQAYALQTYLSNRGHDVKVLDYSPHYLRKSNNRLRQFLKNVLQFPDRCKNKKTFDDFLNKYINLSKKTFHTYDELVNADEKADVYIAGSDQVWNMNMKNGNDDSYFLRFAPEGAKKMSYAASIAMENLSENQKKRFNEMLSDYYAVSVREKSGVKLLKDIEIECSEVCDPVFLLNEHQWDDFSSKNVYKEDYVLVYAFYNQREVYDFAQSLAKERKCKVYSIGTGFREKFSGVDKYFWSPSPKEFVNLVRNSKAVITNSFHGLSFSLIFNKPAYVFRTKTAGNSRIVDILRKIDMYEDNPFRIACVEDYSAVNEKLKEFRETSIAFLESAGI